MLNNFVNDLLDLARIEDGCFKFDMSNFNVHKLVHDVYRMFKITADHQGTKLIYNLTSNFPKLVNGDKTRLQQVLVNLIKNALKFTDNNGFIKIYASYLREEEKIFIKV